MKILDVLKVLAVDLGSANFEEVNKALRSKTYSPVKYRITGESLGHYGYTGVIKAVAKDGLKVFNVNKVTLIRFSEIETFEKAKPRKERPKPVKATAEETAAAKLAAGKSKKTSAPKVADLKKVAPRKPNLVDPRNRR